MKPTTRDLYHLHNRTEFFIHHVDIKESGSIEKAVDGIFKKQKLKDLYIDLPKWNPQAHKKLSQKKKMEQRKKWRKQVAELNRSWGLQMMEKDKGLLKK